MNPRPDQLPELPIIYVSRDLLDRTAGLLASFTRRGPSEGLVYWFGVDMGGQSVVTTLVVPDATATAHGVQTSAAANAVALSVVAGSPLVLIGQAHSHPRGWVDHSVVDDRETFAQYRGALSVVVPWFGRRGLDLGSCGVHRHDGAAYRRIPPEEVEKHLIELPGERDLRQPAMNRREEA